MEQLYSMIHKVPCDWEVLCNCSLLCPHHVIALRTVPYFNYAYGDPKLDSSTKNEQDAVVSHQEPNSLVGLIKEVKQ